MENQFFLNIQEVRQFLPHRTPFLLVDRILEIHPVFGSAESSESRDGNIPSAGVGTRVVGLKNVTFNEPYFQGHFPEYPILPGVLMLETMAQVASFSIYPILKRSGVDFSRGFQCILAGIDSARFRKPVGPGDTLRIETQVTKSRGGKLYAFECVALVDGQKVSEAEILAHLSLPATQAVSSQSGSNQRAAHSVRSQEEPV